MKPDFAVCKKCNRVQAIIMNNGYVIVACTKYNNGHVGKYEGMIAMHPAMKLEAKFWSGLRVSNVTQILPEYQYEMSQNFEIPDDCSYQLEHVLLNQEQLPRVVDNPEIKA